MTHRIASNVRTTGRYRPPLAPHCWSWPPLRLPDVHTAHYCSRQIARSLIGRIAELMPPKWKCEHRKKSRSSNAEHVTSRLYVPSTDEATSPSMLQRGLPERAGQSLKQGGRVVGHHTEAFVGIDTSKSRNAVAIAEGSRCGEVRYLGEFPATEAAIRKLVAK